MKKLSLLSLTLIITTFVILVAQEKDRLLFSHQYHVEEEGIECIDCHAADESVTGSDNLIPEMDVCGDCHDLDDEENCDPCHANPDDPSEANRITEYNQLFSHQKHINASLECITCHGNVANTGIDQHLNIPKMTECMDCHETKTVSVDCQTCHTSEERLKPLSHDLAFSRTHGTVAKNFASETQIGKDCNTCHKNDFCQDCHEGENTDRFTHPLNFEFTHSLSAQGKEKNCFTCHEDRAFCSSCHIDAFNIWPRNHQRAGWTNTADGGQHRIEALIDLESCMSCHENNAEEKCQQCHNN